jgi:hypothetical protein
MKSVSLELLQNAGLGQEKRLIFAAENDEHVTIQILVKRCFPKYFDGFIAV